MTVECKTKTLNERRKSLSIEFFDYQFTVCKSRLGAIRIQSSNEFLLRLTKYFLMDQATDFILRPKITTTDESLRSFKPEDRNCYFENERELKYITTYTKSYCMDECFSNFTFKICRI